MNIIAFVLYSFENICKEPSNWVKNPVKGVNNRCFVTAADCV